jgi:hypothetical protein
MDDGEVQAALNQINERLDYIEDHIVRMSQAGARLLYVPMGRADQRPPDPGNVPPEVVELARAGKRKDAIVRYRALTGADPAQATAVVDGL